MSVQQQRDTHAKPELGESAQDRQQQRILQCHGEGRDLEDHAEVVEARVIKRYRAGL